MHYRFQHNGTVYEIAIERRGDGFQAVVAGDPYALEVLDSRPGQLSLRLDGRPVTLYWAEENSERGGRGERWVSFDGCTYKLERPSRKSARGHGEAGGGERVRAPMPAQVRAVQIEEGDTVAKGDTLLLLEAMKMEIRVKAPSAGQVRRVLVQEGQAVEKEQILVELQGEEQ